jgi:hypothetical protein
MLSSTSISTHLFKSTQLFQSDTFSNQVVTQVGPNQVHLVKVSVLGVASSDSATTNISSANTSESGETVNNNNALSDDVNKATHDEKNVSEKGAKNSNDLSGFEESNATRPTPSQEFQEIATKMFNEDFVSIQPEEYTQFLAENDVESSKIRECYMNLFSWDPNLLVSTRLLCSKLYLKGESQQIDRILSSFTKSYLKQNPKNVFCTRNFEKIYIIIYSLILLNTALHNSEISKKSKISQSDYIKNTFNTFIQESSKSEKSLSIRQKMAIEKELSSYYESLLKDELHLKQLNPSNNLENSSGDLGLKDCMISRAYIRHSHISSDSMEDDAERTLSQQSNGNKHDEYKLSRKISSNSMWSNDTPGTRRGSLVMSRFTSTASSITLFNVHSSSSSTSKGRVGFGRALASSTGDNHSYLRQNSSKLSQFTAAMKSRDSIDSTRSQFLNRRSSKSSLFSRESTNSTIDDTLSVFSLDTVRMSNLKIDDSQLDNAMNAQIEDFDVDNYQDQYDLTLELQGSPYLKEGLLKLKILNNDLHDNLSGSEISGPVSSPNGAVGSKFFSLFSRGQSTSSASLQRGTSSLGTSQPLINKFVENFVVVSKGELSLYSFDPKIIKKHQQKIKKIKQKQFFQNDDDEFDDGAIGDGNWLKNAANIGSYNLCSTYARLEKSITSANGATQFFWSLTFPRTSKRNPKRFIFEAGTNEIALEFVNTCNFWAAKITAIPTMEESVSSIEYGWSDLDGLIARRDQFKKLKNISKWDAIPKGVYLSNYIVANGIDGMADHSGMMKQFVKTYKYYNNLRKLYYEFIELQHKFTTKLPQKIYHCSNYTKIIHNFTSKISEYKSELLKYKSYLVILGFGLQLRFDLEDDDRLAKKGFDDEEDIDSSSKSGITEAEDELTKLVQAEIFKLFSSLKDVSKVIPTFSTSKSINDLVAMNKSNEKQTKELRNEALANMVKSPKSFALVDFNDTESPINQLMGCEAPVMVSSHSTDTITEEEEPEDELEKPRLQTHHTSIPSASVVEGVH